MTSRQATSFSTHPLACPDPGEPLSLFLFLCLSGPPPPAPRVEPVFFGRPRAPPSYLGNGGRAGTRLSQPLSILLAASREGTCRRAATKAVPERQGSERQPAAAVAAPTEHARQKPAGSGRALPGCGAPNWRHGGEGASPHTPTPLSPGGEGGERSALSLKPRQAIPTHVGMALACLVDS